MRFAIWTAVSTKSQAATDKVSLPEQERLCRSAALAKGWIETTGPYIVPGASRTRYVDLRTAERAIPALKHLLDDAENGSFDLLLTYDYTRFRELLDPIARTLAAYGVQIYSISQPIEPVPPEEFDGASETANTQQFVSGFTSRTEIAALRRRYKLGMPGRILKGLPKGTLNFGYRKPPGHEYDRKAIPIQDPVKAPIMLTIKDMFLSGSSLWQIADHLTAQGIRTPRGKTKWTDVHVRRLLKNRFYCGEVTFGETHRSIDLRTGTAKIIKNPPSKKITAKGLHTPLWDTKTQDRIEDEFKKRGKRYTGSRTSRLSNILYCGICGARVWVSYPGGYYNDRGRRWYCSVDPKHVTRKDAELVSAFTLVLKHQLENIQNIPLPQPTDTTETLRANLAELHARRERILEAYETGSLPLTIYTQRTTALETSIAQTERQLAEQSQRTTHHAERLATLGGLAGLIAQTPDYIQQAPAQTVNAALRSIIEKITITRETIAITFL